jgi:hypothetical protein
MKSKNLYLYLALACFVGIVLIFVFDGYMGLYESLTTTDVNFPQQITEDQWQNEGRYGLPGMSIEPGGDTNFQYVLDNRRFSAYTADIDVSLWQNQVKMADLKSETLTLGAFGKGEVDWVLNIDAYVQANAPAGTNYNFTIVIKRGEIERRVMLYVNPTIIIPKPVPVPGE